MISCLILTFSFDSLEPDLVSFVSELFLFWCLCFFSSLSFLLVLSLSLVWSLLLELWWLLDVELLLEWWLSFVFCFSLFSSDFFLFLSSCIFSSLLELCFPFSRDLLFSCLDSTLIMTSCFDITSVFLFNSVSSSSVLCFSALLETVLSSSLSLSECLLRLLFFFPLLELSNFLFLLYSSLLSIVLSNLLLCDNLSVDFFKCVELLLLLFTSLELSRFDSCLELWLLSCFSLCDSFFKLFDDSLFVLDSFSEDFAFVSVLLECFELCSDVSFFSCLCWCLCVELSLLYLRHLHYILPYIYIS